MTAELARSLAFYILVVVSPGEQPDYGWRLEGGYDSCRLAETYMNRHAPHIGTWCLSGVEWHLAGRPK